MGSSSLYRGVTKIRDDILSSLSATWTQIVAKIVWGRQGRTHKPTYGPATIFNLLSKRHIKYGVTGSVGVRVSINISHQMLESPRTLNFKQKYSSRCPLSGNSIAGPRNKTLSVPLFTRAFLKSPSSCGFSAIAQLLVLLFFVLFIIRLYAKVAVFYDVAVFCCFHLWSLSVQCNSWLWTDIKSLEVSVCSSEYLSLSIVIREL